MWKTIATDTTPDGHKVELRLGEFGKGRAKLRTWKMFRDGALAGYASTEQDVQQNWDRVRSGLVRNPDTGRYEKPQPSIYSELSFDQLLKLAQALTSDLDGTDLAETWTFRELHTELYDELHSRVLDQTTD